MYYRGAVVVRLLDYSASAQLLLLLALVLLLLVVIPIILEKTVINDGSIVITGCSAVMSGCYNAFTILQSLIKILLLLVAIWCYY